MSDHAHLIKINASAGSGKTYQLTRRFLKLLAQGGQSAGSCSSSSGNGYGFSEILAITFTNLAAAQMQERITGALKDIALAHSSKPQDGWSASRADAALSMLLRQYSALNIRTIDSLLHHLVRMSALDLHIAPDFEIQFDINELADPIFEEMAMAAQDVNSPLHTLFSKACQLLIESSHKGYKGFVAHKDFADNVNALCKLLITKNCDGLTSLEFLRSLLVQGKRDAGAACAALLKILESEQLEANKNLLKALGYAPQEIKDSALFKKENLAACLVKKSALPSPQAEDCYTHLKDAVEFCHRVEKIIPPALKWQPMVAIAEEIAHRLPDEERQKSALLADRLPLLAAKTLAEGAGVSEAFCRMGNRLTHILLDEFQDTSQQQWTALEPLAVEAVSHGGSVFFVGDVKQAIYGWRGGDARLFDSAPERLALMTDMQYTPLTDNWRSKRRIIQWNSAFFTLFQDAERVSEALEIFLSKADAELADAVACQSEAALRIQKTFENAVQQYPEAKAKKEAAYAAVANGTAALDSGTAPADAASGGVQNAGYPDNDGAVQLFALPVDPGQYAVAALSLLPLMVENLHKRFQFSEIAILVCTNEQASSVASCLLECGIPVMTEGSLLLAEHPLIQECIALLRFLSNPRDNQAFWTLLNSQYLVPSRENYNELLLENAGKHGETALFELFRAAYPDRWNAFFAPLYEGGGFMTAYDTLTEAYERWHVCERLPQEQVFLLRLLEVVHLTEEKGMMDIDSFLAWWDKNSENEKAPLPEKNDAVSVMTIHKSKGLEFEAVLIPFHSLNVKVGGAPELVNLSLAGQDVTLVAPLMAAHGRPYFEAFFNRACDSVNTLYVAWTRAVSELYILTPQILSGKMHFELFLDFLLKQFQLDDVRKEEYAVLYGSSPAILPTEVFQQLGEELPLPLKKKKNEKGSANADNNVAGANNAADSAVQPADAEDDIRDGTPTQRAMQLTERLRGMPCLAASSRNFDSHALEAGDSIFAQNPAIDAAVSLDGTAALDKSGRTCSDTADNTVQNGAVAQDGAAAPDARDAIPALDDFAVDAQISLPMSWLPQIKIFRTRVEDLTKSDSALSAEWRGTLIHRCLEYLVIPRRSADLAAETLAYPSGDVPDNTGQNSDGELAAAVHRAVLQACQGENIPAESIEEFQQILHWFSQLPDAGIWLRRGFREHELVNGDGGIFRVDLLVPCREDDSLLAIDYKTGYFGELPVPDNCRQIQNYRTLLQAATGKKSRGLLIYLDRRQLFFLEADNYE